MKQPPHRQDIEQDFERVADRKQAGKLTKLWSVIVKLIEGEFTGYIKLNFSQGRIGRIEKYEEISEK